MNNNILNNEVDHILKMLVEDVKQMKELEKIVGLDIDILVEKLKSGEIEITWKGLK